MRKSFRARPVRSCTCQWSLGRATPTKATPHSRLLVIGNSTLRSPVSMTCSRGGKCSSQSATRMTGHVAVGDRGRRSRYGDDERRPGLVACLGAVGRVADPMHRPPTDEVDALVVGRADEAPCGREARLGPPLDASSVRAYSCTQTRRSPSAAWSERRRLLRQALAIGATHVALHPRGGAGLHPRRHRVGIEGMLRDTGQRQPPDGGQVGALPPPFPPLSPRYGGLDRRLTRDPQGEKPPAKQLRPSHDS